MAWEQDAESWRVVGKNTCPRISIVFHFEIIKEKWRDPRPGYEWNPSRGRNLCSGIFGDLSCWCSPKWSPYTTMQSWFTWALHWGRELIWCLQMHLDGAEETLKSLRDKSVSWALSRLWKCQFWRGCGYLWSCTWLDCTKLKLLCRTSVR